MRLNYSKCEKCGARLNISELEENPNGVGMVCKNKSACKERKIKRKK